jgi:serine/threonine protein kinase
VKICPACSREYGDEHSHCRDDGVALVHLETGSNDRVQDLIGQIVDGRYRIERIVGRGGMGTVYACRHVVVGKEFAIKVLRPGIERSEEILQRFIREAQAANAVQSRHICAMSDFGQLPSGAFYVVMDLLHGMSLTRALREKKLQRDDINHVFSQVAETLEKAHRAGIIHRDLKPDNVVLVHDDGDPYFVKLVDFGIAKLIHHQASSLTETGVILGTPYYMSPEQARGEAVDHRSDIYALGVMMYRAFTGKLPFIADTAMGVLTRHLTEQPELPSRIADVDRRLEQIILRCMEKKPVDRFQNMADLAAALRAVDDGRVPESAPTVDERSPLFGQLPLGRAEAGDDSDSVPTPTKIATPQAHRASTPPVAPRRAPQPPPGPAPPEVVVAQSGDYPYTPHPPTYQVYGSSDSHSLPPALVHGHPSGGYPYPPIAPGAMADPLQGEAATNRGLVSSRYNISRPQRNPGRMVVWIASGLSLIIVGVAAAIVLFLPADGGRSGDETSAPAAGTSTSDDAFDEASSASAEADDEQEALPRSEPSSRAVAGASASAMARPPKPSVPPPPTKPTPSPQPAAATKATAEPEDPPEPLERPRPEIRSPFED